MEDKIKTLEELKEILENHKREGKKIVHCHGVFDIIHFGHIQHFLAAKKKGDILVVTITPDRFIEKGPGRPFFNEEIRLKHISHLEMIDYVALNKWSTAVETIKIIKPDIYAKGKEVLGNKNIDRLEKKSNLELEKEAVESIGGELFLTDEITFSSSHIINSITSSLPEEAKYYLQSLKEKTNAEEIIKVLDSLKKIKVLVMGDPIIDEYVYCKSLGKASKEPLVVYRYLSSEIFLGGVFSVANHISTIVENTALLTFIDEEKYSLIEKNLNSNIERHMFLQKDGNIINKKRYLDEYKRLKIFEVYNADEFCMEKETEDKIINFLENNLFRFDLIVLADYGHGFFTERLINYLSETEKFIAITCQINAGNMGYNFITKYKKADFVSLNEVELRLPFQNKNSDIKNSIEKLRDMLNVKKINVTLGKKGMIYFQEGNFFYFPALNQYPLDTIGAGDSVFSLLSLLSYKNISPEIIPFLGNCIGGIKIKYIGNKKFVNIQELKKFINYILK